MLALGTQNATVLLSHLAGSNRGPHLYERCALPTELRWPGAVDQDRTGDLVITNDVLYRLSYNGTASTVHTKRFFPFLQKEKMVLLEGTLC